MKKIRGEKGINPDLVPWIMLGVALLIVMIGVFVVLRAKGISASELWQNLIRLRR